MRSYTDLELLSRAKLLGFIPNEYPTIIAIQNKIDNFTDDFIDKGFLFSRNSSFISKFTCTTRSGQTALKEFMNPKGTFIWKTDMVYTKCFKYGLHNGRMKALRLDRPVYGYRDSDKDNLHEEKGTLVYENPSCNCHGVSYEELETNEKLVQKIGTWSYCCQVLNNMKEYRQLIKYVYENGGYANYILLKEF